MTPDDLRREWRSRLSILGQCRIARAIISRYRAPQDNARYEQHRKHLIINQLKLVDLREKDRRTWGANHAGITGWILRLLRARERM
jgi:hypothetical protein